MTVCLVYLTVCPCDCVCEGQGLLCGSPFIYRGGGTPLSHKVHLATHFHFIIPPLLIPVTIHQPQQSNLNKLTEIEDLEED